MNTAATRAAIKRASQQARNAMQQLDGQSVDALMEIYSDAMLEQAALQARATKDLDMTAVPLARLAEYAAEDADVTWQLAAELRPLLEESGQELVLTGIEGPLLPVLVRMEMEGIAIDSGALSEIGNELQVQIDSLAG